MILFNLLFNQQISANCYNDFNSMNVLKSNVTNTLISTKLKYSFNENRSINSSIVLLAKNNQQELPHQYHFINENQIKQILANSFFMRFINQYWKETIFISIPPTSIQLKIQKMQFDQLSLYSHEYKNFLLDFSKALVNGRIQVRMQSDNKMVHIHNYDQFWEITWKKGFNFIELDNLFKSIFFYIKIYWSYINKLESINCINYQMLPLFTILNEFNQVILAESPNKMFISNSLLDVISQAYTNITRYNRNLHDKYLALFFVNPHDAVEYSQSIQNRYNNLTNQLIKVFPTKLSLYYKLRYLYQNNIDFRLIPDLKEVKKLINHYQYDKNISFQLNQKYGKDFFQGQPIYIIKPIMAIHRESKQKHILHYSYNIIKNRKEVEYEAVFLNYDTAMNAWLKFKQHMKMYKLPHKPTLNVFNLESFMKTEDRDTIVCKKNIIFIPSYESYQYVKSNIKLTSQLNVVQKFFNKYVYLKIVMQRIIWSLTSRQPINW